MCFPLCHKSNPNFSGGRKKKSIRLTARLVPARGLSRESISAGALFFSLTLAFTAQKSEWQDAASAAMRIFKQNRVCSCQPCSKRAATFSFSIFFLMPGNDHVSHEFKLAHLLKPAPVPGPAPHPGSLLMSHVGPLLL